MEKKGQQKFRKKQMKTYISMMADVLNTENPKIISNELKKSGTNIKEENVYKHLNDESFEIESRKIEFSCRMDDIFKNDF